MALVPPDSMELRRRADQARSWLQSCEVCRHQCRVNRQSSVRGFCGLDGRTRCFKRHISFSEEIEFLPSLMVYLSGCNLRCGTCIQSPHSLDPLAGELVEPRDWAGLFESAVERGAKTINLVGGEPSLHLHTVLSIACHARRPLPLVLNSNMYMTPGALALLDGVVGVYLADFKFGNNDCARRIAGVDGYVETVTANLRQAFRQGDLLIRHLLLPGHVECCLRPVAKWIAQNLPSAGFHLMTSYVPPWHNQCVGDLARMTDKGDVALAERTVRELGLLQRDGCNER